MEQNGNRKCGQCNSVILGRSDKRYCSEQCRAIHNNQKRQHDSGEKFILQTNSILRKNRTILKQASPYGKTTLSRKVLEQAGFDFRYFTSQYRTNRGNVYNFCYDFGYLLLPESKVLIVNYQPYMDSKPVN